MPLSSEIDNVHGIFIVFTLICCDQATKEEDSDQRKQSGGGAARKETRLCLVMLLCCLRILTQTNNKRLRFAFNLVPGEFRTLYSISYDRLGAC